MDFLIDSIYLNGLEVIRLKKDKRLYLFCGYGKNSILKRAHSVTNYAYKSEIYLLGRTLLPEYKLVGLVGLLGGSGTFLSLNEDGNLDVDSKYKYLRLKEDSYDIVGKMTENDIFLWQSKMKLLQNDRHLRKFLTRDDALNIILNDKTYEVSAEKDEILVNKFYDLFVNVCTELGLDASYYIQYNKTNKTDSNIYPFAYPYDIKRVDDTLYFYRLTKYRSKNELYGKCSVQDKKEVVNLFLARNLGKKQFLAL